MSTKKKTLGLTVAVAAAIVFATAPITSTIAQAAATKVPCYGINSCQGKSTCKTANNDCKGHNSCKGKGMLMKTASQCKKLGGSLKEST